MRGNELLDKMVLVDPAYIEAAEAVPKRKIIWGKLGALAACLCLITGVCLIPALRHDFPAPPVPAVPTGTPSPNPNSPIEREPVPDVYPPHTVLRPGDEGYNVPAETVNPSETHGSFLPFIGSDTMGADLPDITPMISHFGKIAPYAPQPVPNGEMTISHSLTAAMAHYGDTANYRVLVTLFRDGQPIPGGAEAAWLEANRLSGLGYTVAMETYGPIADPAAWVTYFTLHATHAQLSAFSAAEDFGYSLMLYGEYFGGDTTGDIPVVFHGFAGATTE